MNDSRLAAPSVRELAGLQEISELARPVVEATERLRTVVDELKFERTRAVADLRRAVLDLGQACPPERRAELARVLYWRHTEVPISDITVAFGYDQSALLGAVGTVRTPAKCEDCEAILLASSRQQFKELEKLAMNGPARYGPRALCRRCASRRDRGIFVDPPDDVYDNDPEAWDEPPTAG